MTHLTPLSVFDDIQANWFRITEILNNASFIGDHSNFYAHNDLGANNFYIPELLVLIIPSQICSRMVTEL